MEVRPGRIAGHPDCADLLAHGDLLADFDVEGRIQVPVQGFAAVVMADSNDDCAAGIALGQSHGAGSGSQNRRAERRGEVHALVVVRVVDAVHGSRRLQVQGRRAERLGDLAARQRRCDVERSRTRAGNCRCRRRSAVDAFEHARKRAGAGGLLRVPRPGRIDGSYERIQLGDPHHDCRVTAHARSLAVLAARCVEAISAIESVSRRSALRRSAARKRSRRRSTTSRCLVASASD